VDRLGDQYFTGIGLPQHPRRYVDPDPTHIPRDMVHRSHVHAAPDFDAALPHRIAHRPGAHHCLRRLIEDRQKTVTCGRDLSPPETSQLAANARVVLLQHFVPGMVSQLRGALGRANDVSEKYGNEGPLGHHNRVSSAGSPDQPVESEYGRFIGG
jgi:hypothetical protein